jgi:metal-dependent amidase/aminoacylase/carboxypeptidase family protein
VVAGKVKLLGTARTLSASQGKRVPRLIRRTVSGVCKAHGAKFEIIEPASYPILDNDESVNQLYRSTLDTLFGRGRAIEAEPILGGEDFACYLEKVPGAMCRLGIRNPKIGADQPWHSSKFIADEEAIFVGTALLAGSTLTYLG